MGRSPAVETALYVIPFVTAPISFLSSSYLMVRIVRKGRRNLSTKPREQLLLGLSILDLFGSLGLAFSTTPGPSLLQEDVSYPTYGNVATCSAQGFFVQLGTTVPLYNAALCLYYLLSIRYKYKDDYLLKWIIPILHLGIGTFAIGTATAGIVLKLFNYAGTLGCWISSGWRICRFDSRYCNRGQNANEYELYFGLIHVGFCFLFVLISMMVLYCTVRSIEARSRRWIFAPNTNTNNMPTTTSTTTTGTTTSSSYLSRQPQESTTTTKESSSSAGASTSMLPKFMKNMISHKTSTTAAAATTTTTTAVGAPPTPLSQQAAISSSQQASVVVIATDMTLTRRMMVTGILYGSSFILVYLPTVLLGVVHFDDTSSTGYVTLLLLAVTLLPLQGFFNMLIYTSPDWLSWFHQRRQNLSCCCCKDIPLFRLSSSQFFTLSNRQAGTTASSSQSAGRHHHSNDPASASIAAAEGTGDDDEEEHDDSYLLASRAFGIIDDPTSKRVSIVKMPSSSKTGIDDDDDEEDDDDSYLFASSAFGIDDPSPKRLSIVQMSPSSSKRLSLTQLSSKRLSAKELSFPKRCSIQQLPVVASVDDDMDDLAEDDDDNVGECRNDCDNGGHPFVNEEDEHGVAAMEGPKSALSTSPKAC